MIGNVIWGICIGVMVHQLNKKEGLDYNPIIYGLLGFLFGAIFGFAMYFGRYFKDKEKSTASIVSYVIAVIFAVINVLLIFA